MTATTLGGTTATTAPARVAPAWLRGPRFDASLLGLPVALALACGATLIAAPATWPLVLLVDTWLLGFHHVIATWSKLALDPDDRREHRLLWTALPVLALAAVLATAAAGGTIAVVTVYFHWQWWHYLRQSWGLYRLFARRAGAPDDRLATVVLYGWGALGLAHRAWEGTPNFLGLPLAHLPVRGEVVALLAVVVGAATLAWAARELVAWRRGTLAPLPALFLLTHVAIFAWGYLAMDGLTQGWLVVNVWHNAQYLLLVWHAQAARFGRAPDRSPRLARLATPAGALAWFVAGLAVTGVVYGALAGAIGERALLLGVPALLIAHQAINWHHYVVDSRIWRLRRPRVAQGLGLAPALDPGGAGRSASAGALG